MKGKIRVEKGITLIALIITIVILLILAAVAISSITNDGILSYATNAAKDYNKAVLNEKYYLTELEEFLTQNQTGIKVEKVTDANPGKIEGTGTQADPYMVNSMEDFVFFSYDVNSGNTYEGKYVKLGYDLDFNSTKSYVEGFRTDYAKYGYNGELKTALTSGEGWLPIGSINGSENLSFYGTFDGNNHTIFNLYMNREIEFSEGNQYYGLFARNYGTIKNLTVNVNIKMSSSQINIFTGGIAADNSTTAKIENCASYGSIDVEGYKDTGNCYVSAGGIVGKNSGTIDECKNNATIIGDGAQVYLGGIAGSIHEGNVYKSYNIGKISLANYYGNKERAGGISGQFYRSNMDHCYNLGEIVGTFWTGAIVGYLQSSSSADSTITNCGYNNSRISGLGTYENDIVEETRVKVQITKNENLTEAEVLNILKNL